MWLRSLTVVLLQPDVPAISLAGLANGTCGRFQVSNEAFSQIFLFLFKHNSSGFNRVLV